MRATSAAASVLIVDETPQNISLLYPDSILFKPGRLNDSEWKIIQTHCEIGKKIIGGNQIGLLNTAATVALTHHERWDGSGYPQGLKQNDIPLFGRIVAVADVFDALTSNRPYKSAWPVAKAVEEIGSCRERHFDPQIVDSFLSKIPEIMAIHQQFTDAT
jgi:putative two-component system response regulator